MEEISKDNAVNESDSLNSEYSIRVSDDKKTVYLSCTADAIANDELIDTVLNRLRLLKITAKPDMTTLEAAVAGAKVKSAGLQDLEIARGLDPVKAIDAKLEWTGDYFGDQYVVDPVTKKIDFKQKISNPNVDKGKLLAKVRKASPGKNGRDVYGHAIIVLPPKDLSIMSGTNVYWSEELSGYCAMIDGRVKLNRTILDVDPVYYAKNGLNSETGNIIHNGEVVIAGDADPEFKVEATGDIEIRGIAYAIDIKCKSNLIAKEGINSNVEKSIDVDGDIMAKYIMNANVSGGGNITVNKEIYQSNVDAKGVLKVEGGRIIGGELYGTKGIIVGEAGSKGNVKTLLIAGVDKNLLLKRRQTSDEIARIKEAIQTLEKAYRKLKQNIQLLGAEQKETMSEIEKKKIEGEEEVERLVSENRKLYEKIRENGKARIIIKDLVNAGVILRIADSVKVVNSVLLGPLYAYLDQQTGEICLASLDEKSFDKSIDENKNDNEAGSDNVESALEDEETPQE